MKININDLIRRLEQAEKKYAELNGKHSLGANYERMYRQQEGAALRELHMAQRALFRAQNGLSKTGVIDPVRFHKQFPDSKALVKPCPADKRRSVEFDREAAKTRTLVIFGYDYLDDPIDVFRPHERYDWLHNNVETDWEVSCAEDFEELGFDTFQTVISFDCEKDALLFSLKFDAKVVAGTWSPTSPKQGNGFWD